jgi:CheY-like chemotaxis protein
MVKPEDGASRVLLYIEDNLSNVRLLERIVLLRPGTKLLVAIQGSLGLDLARQHRPDLILLDLHLSDMHGSEVLRQLQRDLSTQTIPVVIISADATKGEIERLRMAGARHYLTKPLDIPELFEIIDQVLNFGDGDTLPIRT